jgi:hypothetical protein
VGSADPRRFEHGVVEALQQFAAFEMGTVRLLSLRGHGEPLNDSAWSTSPQKSLNSTVLAATGVDDGSSSISAHASSKLWQVVSYAVWGLLGLSVVGVLAVRVGLACRRTGRSTVKVMPAEDLEAPAEPPSPVLDVPEGAAAFAERTFRSAEMEACPDFDGKFLSLHRGQFLEVVSDCGGWLYGSRLGEAARGVCGFFPENRIAWVGRPVTLEGEAAPGMPACSLHVPEREVGGEADGEGACSTCSDTAAEGKSDAEVIQSAGSSQA